MTFSRLRREIAYEAARLLFTSQESEFYRARMRAGRLVCNGWAPVAELPSYREIRGQIQTMARLNQADARALDGRQENGFGSHEERADRFQVYRTLLLPLETVRQDPRYHPEGDVLYHSLQAYDLARNCVPYDEELQLAALLHDVGKAIDPRDHIAAGLAALNGHITPRTAWLIAHQDEAKEHRDGTLGQRSRRRLEASDDFHDLMLLHDCDRRAHRSGVDVPDPDQALARLRNLASEWEE